MKNGAFTLCLVLCTALLFSGCASFLGLNPNANSQPDTSRPPAVSESENQPILRTPEGVAPVQTATSEPPSEAPPPEKAPSAPSETAPETSPYIGVFTCYHDQASPGYYPLLELFPNNSFTLTVNLYEGMGHVYGSWTDNGTSLDMSVSDRDFSGFVGDDVTAFSFVVQDSNTLIYTGDSIGMTETGNIFSK